MQGQPGSDRDWEHWPGRRPPDERMRNRLRSLFTPTEQAADEVEALIAERGRELEERTHQLASAVADLERREESARRLRIAVEEMLRRGSAELDDRHAELNALAAELAERERRLAASEEELEERRRELGAVELRRAAVERREAAADERGQDLQRAAGELQARRQELDAAAGSARDAEVEREQLDTRQAALTEAVADLEARTRTLTAAQAALAERERRVADVEERDRVLARREAESPSTHDPPDAAPARTHLLFQPGDRYRLEEVAGPTPEPGSVVEGEAGPHLVLRVGPSPFPGDPRRCAYLEPAASADAGPEPD